MKILSIGNSFSQDAQRYLHELAKAEGVDIQTQNLYIGGCSLETHYQNMKGDLMEYELERTAEARQKKRLFELRLKAKIGILLLFNRRAILAGTSKRTCPISWSWSSM